GEALLRAARGSRKRRSEASRAACGSATPHPTSSRLAYARQDCATSVGSIVPRTIEDLPGANPTRHSHKGRGAGGGEGLKGQGLGGVAGWCFTGSSPSS